MSEFRPDKAAKALLEAELVGDAEAAATHHVSRRSIEEWRVRLRSDDEFFRVFMAYKLWQDREWAAKIPPVIVRAVEFLERAFADGDHKDPAMVRAVAQALDTLGSTWAWRSAIDGRVLTELRHDRAPVDQHLATAAGAGAAGDLLTFRRRGVSGD